MPSAFPPCFQHGSLFFGNKIRVQLREVPNEHLGVSRSPITIERWL